jgi:hypothetical protein
MKRIAASVGLVAIGVSTLHTHGSELQGSKPWSIGVSLRGFYDDNVNGTKHDKIDTTGFEVSPTVGIGMSRDQTSADLSYTYSGKYYDERPGTSDHWDHTHIINAGLDHRFNPRNSISLQDSFVIGQEPDVLRVLNAPTATFQRVPGDNIRNYGSVIFNTEATELLGFELGYANGYFNYADDDETIDGFGNVIASNSGLLDRMEHRIHIDSRWHFRPETVGILGYQFAQIDYTGDELVTGNVFTGAIESDDRDYRTHSVYLGVEHSFSPALSGALKLGGQYADYYGAPDGDNDVTPYVMGSLSYAYAEECSAQLGVQHILSAADLIGTSTSDFVQNAESTTVYGSIVHRILPSLYGTLMGTYQHSTYNGGGPGIDDESDDFLQVGVDLSYRFTPHFSAHAGYNYDNLNSGVDVREDFSRNRFYLGLTAQY